MRDTCSTLIVMGDEKPSPSPRLREALVDILAHCDEANVVYAHQPNCTCDRCIIGRIARKALEEE